MKSKSILIFSALLFLILDLPAQKVDKVDSIINRYLKTIGGAANWKKVTSIKVTGKLTTMGAELPMTIYSKPPNKQKLVISFQGKEIIQSYDGTEMWMLNPLMGSTEPQKVPAEQAKDMADDDFENEFIDYKKKGYTAKYTGTEDVDGSKCYKIEFTKKGSASTYFIDAENYVTLLVKSTASAGPVAGQEVSRYMSDYQDVKGLMISFATEIKAGGQTLQKLTFEKVELNEAFDDSVFAFPKK